MKIFSDFSHYSEDQRYSLNDITKALWNKRTPEERDKVYGVWARKFESVDSIADTDVVLLTYKWNYYVVQDRIDQAREEVMAAQANGKPVVVFNGGDSSARLPFEGAVLFEPGGYRSARGLAYHSGFPSFTGDYMAAYCGGELRLRQKSSAPVIGFCGQASTSLFQTAYRGLRLKQRQARYRQGRLKWEPPPFETTSFRRRVLKQFEGQAGIRTNYLLRSKYRAGDTQDKSPHHPARLEFVNNILNSDYTLCMRGGGNFSVRFYEALSLGRIPIFIDSDCLLPFEDTIPYRKMFSWIGIADLAQAAQIVADFHDRLSDKDFADLQKACRDLWLRHFTPDGFYTDLHAKLNELI